MSRHKRKVASQEQAWEVKRDKSGFQEQFPSLHKEVQKLEETLRAAGVKTSPPLDSSQLKAYVALQEETFKELAKAESEQKARGERLGFAT